MALIEGNNCTRPPIRNGASRRRGVSLSRNRCARALSRFDLSEGGTRFRIQTMLSKYRLPFIHSNIIGSNRNFKRFPSLENDDVNEKAISAFVERPRRERFTISLKRRSRSVDRADSLPFFPRNYNPISKCSNGGVEEDDPRFNFHFLLFFNIS